MRESLYDHCAERGDRTLPGQWHPDLNGELTPQTVTPYSNRRVWWLCERGHTYQATVAHRTREKSGCPYCSGKKALPGYNDLATLYPQIADEWHPDLNGELTPQAVTPGSHRAVWWRCADGHEWKARIDSRTGKKKPGCPVCAGKTGA